MKAIPLLTKVNWKKIWKLRKAVKHTQTLKKPYLTLEGDLAAQIKTLQKELGMSQQELADKIGKPKSTIGRIEAGLSVPRADTLYKVSGASKIQLSLMHRFI